MPAYARSDVHAIGPTVHPDGRRCPGHTKGPDDEFLAIDCEICNPVAFRLKALWSSSPGTRPRTQEEIAEQERREDDLRLAELAELQEARALIREQRAARAGKRPTKPKTTTIVAS